MDEHFNKFIDRIGFYKNSIYQIDTHLKEFIRFRKNNLPKNISEDFVMPILSSKLIYRNVLTSKHEIKQSRFIHIDNIEEKTQEIKDNYCNFCVSQSFEAFETFLKDILAHYIFSNPNFVLENEKLKVLKIENYDTCRIDIQKILQKNNKYNKQIFNWLYQINSEISKLEKENFLDFNFAEWNIVLTEIRHSIVHSNSHLKIEKTKNWTDFQNRLLNELFTCNVLDKEIVISTYENYDYIIGIIAQHGQLIYDKIKNCH